MPIRLPMNVSSFSEDFAAGFSPLISLVYVSASVELMSNEALDEILTSSRANNGSLGLTGMLLYYDGAFMQVLEGPEQAVHQMYARIGRDPRHTGMITLLEEYIPERNFPDWSMGYHRLNLDEAQQLEAFTSFAEADQFLEYFQTTPQKSLTLLQSFRKQARR
jgi:hypothetical protein